MQLQLTVSGAQRRRQSRDAQNGLEKGSNERSCEIAFPSWLVSHPESASSVDSLSGDSLRIVAGSLSLFLLWLDPAWRPLSAATSFGMESKEFY